MYALTIGTDPEVFLRDDDGRFFSAHDLVPGSKHFPSPVSKGALQPDGVAAEFNIEPASTSDEFVENIAEVMKQLQEQIKSLRPDLLIAISPTATFDQEYFDSLPDEAKELGCTPDYNAYTGKANSSPSTSKPFRTGSGHIHVGWGEGFLRADRSHFLLCRDVVKQLDAVLYPASLLWDQDDQRRTLYGKIGAFRPCRYGVEYRPLSNAYLSSKKIQEYVFETTRRLSDLLLNQGVRVFDDSEVQDMVAMIQADVTPSEEKIREYLSSIESKYGVPAYE